LPEVRESITRHTAYNKHDTGWAKGAPSEYHTTPPSSGFSCSEPMPISLEAHSLDRQTDCLGPGATIAPREVAAMVACIREAIAVHRPDVDKHHRIQLSGPVPEFNVVYGTDSSSAHRRWRRTGTTAGHAPDPGQEQDLLACRDAAPRLARATSTRCNLHPSQATRSRGGLEFYPACAPTPEALTSIALLLLPLELGVSRIL
jgi:hypothetical protein